MVKAVKHKEPIQIEILGPGNAVSQMTAQVLDAAIRDLGLIPDRDIHLNLIRDSSEIAASGVYWTPAVRINGDLKCTGRVPSLKEVQGWLKQPSAQPSAPSPPSEG
ncbi:thioredoxin family protein [bacterium]|nr:thioredoxin family protein [bacterium]MBU1937351.1 thioredoxin family protein [bacterium]